MFVHKVNYKRIVEKGAHALRKWTRFYFADTNLIKIVIKQYLVNLFFGSICVLLRKDSFDVNVSRKR